jgi:tetratricopeptide (TPR) repeat protein
LIHPARRLWKRRLESCALSSLEREILAVQRTGEDVPGYEIPYRYFLYQRSGDGKALAGVFYHNLLDILSLAALAVHVDLVLTDPFAGLVSSAVDFLSVAKIAERAEQPDMAIACYEEAIRLGLSGEMRVECLTRLGGVQKRLRFWDGALQTWELMVDAGGDLALLGLVEIAKYYEHVERDYLQAMEVVRQALALAEIRRESEVGDSLADLEHRLGRLLNRSMRSRGAARSRV